MRGFKTIDDLYRGHVEMSAHQKHLNYTKVETNKSN